MRPALSNKEARPLAEPAQILLIAEKLRL